MTAPFNVVEKQRAAMAFYEAWERCEAASAALSMSFGEMTRLDVAAGTWAAMAFGHPGALTAEIGEGGSPIEAITALAEILEGRVR